MSHLRLPPLPTLRASHRLLLSLTQQQRFYTSPSLASDAPSHHPVTTLSSTHLHVVPDRPNLSLLITTPPDTAANTPTILSLSSSLTPPSSSITITPQYPSTTTFPALLHDLTISLHTTRALFPESRTGFLASSYLGGLALSTALTQGRTHVPAVAVHEPVVDLFAQGEVSYDSFFRKWVSAGGAGERERLFGQDPGLYWADPFASPLFWFVSAGVVFPHRWDGCDERLQPLGTEPRRMRYFPPPGFVPGVGWTMAEGDKRLPRMLVSLGEGGNQTKARTVFMDCAGTQAAVAREGAEMGVWLERVLMGREGIEGFVHPEPKRELLERMMAGEPPIFEAVEKDALPGGVTIDTGIDVESIRKEVLIMKMRKAKAAAAEAKKTLVTPRKPVVGVVGAMKAMPPSFGVKTTRKELQKKPVTTVKTALCTTPTPAAKAAPTSFAVRRQSPSPVRTASTSFVMKKEWQKKPAVTIRTAPARTALPVETTLPTKMAQLATPPTSPKNVWKNMDARSTRTPAPFKPKSSVIGSKPKMSASGGERKY